MDPKQLFLKPLETAVNQVLRLDPDADALLRPLVGRSVLVELRGPELTTRAYFSERGVSLSLPDPEDPAPDARVSLTLPALLTLLRSGGESAQGVEFKGEIGVVHALRKLVSQLEIDWEERLSRFTGDIVAHQIGSAARGIGGWLSHVQRTFEQNLGEYLTEEARQLPPAAEVASFLDDVDRLRQDADRLEARLERLERSKPS